MRLSNEIAVLRRQATLQTMDLKSAKNREALLSEQRAKDQEALLTTKNAALRDETTKQALELQAMKDQVAHQQQRATALNSS